MVPPPPYSRLRLGDHVAPNANERLFHNGTSPPLQVNIELGGRGGDVCTCARFVGERYFHSHRKEHAMHIRSSRVCLPFACWRLTHGMAPHLTLAELDFINEKKQDGLTPVQIHARSAAQRTKKKIATPHLTNVRKAPKGKVCKRGRVETRGRRPKFTRAMVLRMTATPHLTNAYTMVSLCVHSAFTVPTQCPHSAHTVPTQCPHGKTNEKQICYINRKNYILFLIDF